MCVCPERKREREPDEEGEGAEGGVDREGEGVGGGREGEAAEAEASRYQPPGRTFSRSVACETVSAEDLSRSFHFPFFSHSAESDEFSSSSVYLAGLLQSE